MKGEVRTVDGRRVATPEYRSWQMMKNRCLNPKARDYRFYGGRGIGVCDRWLTFDAFLEDMGRRPFAGATLERKDANKGYEPDNCCWASRSTQARNRPYAKSKTWVLAENLGVSKKTAEHMLWQVRRKAAGDTTYFCMSPEKEAAVMAHIKEHNLWI